MYDSGIKPTVANASLERYVIDECKNAKMAAKDIMLLRLNENLQHLSEERAELEETMANALLSETNHKKIEDKLSAIELSYDRKIQLQSSEESPAFKAMVSRVAQNLIEKNRLKARRAGAGRQEILDEETMDMVVHTLKSECDAVMYCDRSRIKECDLLEIANHNLEEQGKKTIKSSRTVALWQKPRERNTREGRRHRQALNGRYFFTCKKPEKTLEATHIPSLLSKCSSLAVLILVQWAHIILYL